MNQAEIIARVIELSGGVEQLKVNSDRSLQEINSKWHQYTEIIGRVLRSHLFVEHYMAGYLVSSSLSTSRKKADKLTFAQKVDLVEQANEPQLEELLAGIRCLNRIRNNIAHNLAIELTLDSIKAMADTKSFVVLRRELAKPNEPCSKPISVIESFSKHVGVVFESISDPNSLSRIFAKVLAEQQT
ncbi:hypothetical protein [Vibrio parahaemolyticus]|uniref:hypothetical protein n=1 Tax=Vibrio parahaemolyticus TaxID=670 RepID=UPI0003C77534|nr:hypothetical protein [Vibrio parahaemolyticus]MDF5409691.1 hypothetical protein [Vibrio parahaemolyticus]MDG2825182.1 hypothetical protein [Vibrio parahaemolyticus]MDG2844934.1 hypothetical protein [Vibrio parahaemolyticus]MDG2860884.1 hypothetical protein [Vibrio parahaemolyticus]MDG2865809.1 hypothetical protein [Vibrio parahaemolyticus]